jgi:hypothetical protein
MIALIFFVLAALASPFKSKRRLEAEDAALQHQLIILRRKVRAGRLAQPPYRRCEAGGAFESLNCRRVGGLCPPIAKTDLFDHIQALDCFIALEHELNERMFFGLCGQAAG